VGRGEELAKSSLVVALIRNIDIIVGFNSWSRDGPDENE
jgi:hypothetical protein